jgi:outer membrane protein TolC
MRKLDLSLQPAHRPTRHSRRCTKIAIRICLVCVTFASWRGLATAAETRPMDATALRTESGVVRIAAPPVRRSEEVVTPPPTAIDQRVLTLDFTNALAIAAGQNPQVAFANARIREAYARYDQARIQWLPSVNAGASLNHHEGPLQATDGNVGNISRSSLESGLGVQAVGAGSPVIPGLVANFQLADAIFQPRINSRIAAARRQEARATTNDVILEAAVRFQELLSARQDQAITTETVERAHLLADLTAEFARVGQGAPADADMSAAELRMRRTVLEGVDGQILVTSARLAETLSLDPSVLIVPAESAIVPVEVIGDDLASRDLVAIAWSTRPELSASRQLVNSAVERVRRERSAPLVPSILLGVSYGGFGGGDGRTIGAFDNRMDVDAVAYWQLRQLGLGDRAARDEACAALRAARAQVARTMDQVSREVMEAHALVDARRRQIDLATEAVKASKDSYERNLVRIRNGQGIPLELLQSIDAADRSNRAYLQAVVGYNIAQFQLARALGWRVSE